MQGKRVYEGEDVHVLDQLHEPSGWVVLEPLYTHPSPADTDWKNNVLAGDMKAIVDGDGNVLYVNKKIFDREVERTNETLATVSALTADAERLAEALRNLVSEWVAIADDGDATLEDSTIGYRACANRLSAMLAAQENHNG